MKFASSKNIILGAALLVIGGLGIYAFSHASNPALHKASVEAIVETVPVPPEHPIQVPVLTYHTIAPATDKPEGKMQKHYHITPENFEAQMKYLDDNGYHPIRFDAYANYLSGKTALPEKPVVLTFDDGWDNQYEYAYPILVKYGFTGTFFIISNVIGGSYMSWDEIRDLDAHGFEIASHTETHKKLPDISDEMELRNQIFGSKEKLESELGHAIATIAYPYYLSNESIRESVKAAGYLAARGGWSGSPNSLDTIFYIKSQEPVNTDNPFAEKLR